MWCAVRKLKPTKENRWLSPVPKPSPRCSRNIPPLYQSFEALKTAVPLALKESCTYFSPPATLVVRLWPWRSFSSVVELFIECVLVESPCCYFICLFVWFFVFPLCCGGRCIWAWRAFRCVPFRCTSLLFLRFVAFFFFFTHCSVISWPTSLGGCWISNVSKCCSVVPVLVVPPNVSV